MKVWEKGRVEDLGNFEKYSGTGFRDIRGR